MPAPVKICTPRSLPHERWVEAAKAARRTRSENVPPGFSIEKAPPRGGRLALDYTRYWGEQGAKLTVGWIDKPPSDLRARLLSHMNAWSARANVEFVEVEWDPMVRVSLGPGGYWSYVGTDVKLIDEREPTMNLEGFTMDTPESEFVRVVRHEAGHTLGFPHEHMRAALIQRLDREKVITAFMASQGWSREEVIAQILTPLDELKLIGTPGADATSIMCYEIPAELTLDGEAIVGGNDINELDFQLAALVYPREC